MSITANLLALAGRGWLYNNLTGHPWPHRGVRPPEPAGPWAYTHEDLEAVLAEWDELLDVDVDELDALFRAVDRRATTPSPRVGRYKPIVERTFAQAPARGAAGEGHGLLTANSIDPGRT